MSSMQRGFATYVAQVTLSAAGVVVAAEQFGGRPLSVTWARTGVGTFIGSYAQLPTWPIAIGINSGDPTFVRVYDDNNGEEFWLYCTRTLTAINVLVYDALYAPIDPTGLNLELGVFVP